ncbi:LysR substrate-binding domain-containing protein [Paracoccus sp. TK19116]|uniref:LysR substrate-binding domain-containing protein n=1 Tax=Paracoccus albicereus TaxID=2922394 RepID=A0ABT1MS50_9RHOB|nr:LysR substrate-binding domain-containing protein [Paracoccus albicereus]MCQ0971137.1 LysR substrate-binding domain-containing protein [Paracoccus albicereus]
MNTGLDLRQLRYFVCLAEELHFGRAAERLGIAQAPLSQQIKAMEERLGVALFHRTTRRTRLTAAGETLLSHARNLLDGMDRAVSHTRAMAGQSSGRLTIAGVNMAMTHVIPPILAEFRKQWPAVIVDIRHLGTTEQLRVLGTGEVDVALIRPTDQAAFMQVEALLLEGFVAALPKGHPLAAKNELTLSEILEEPIIGYAPVLGTHYAILLREAFRRAGLTPRVVQECTHTTSVASQVASGLGLAVMPSWIRNIHSPYLEFRPVPELPCAIELAMAWPRGEASPMLRDFLDTTRRIVRQVAHEQGFALPA